MLCSFPASFLGLPNSIRPKLFNRCAHGLKIQRPAEEKYLALLYNRVTFLVGRTSSNLGRVASRERHEGGLFQ